MRRGSSVSPITPDATQEDKVVDQDVAGAVATRGLVVKIAVFFPPHLSSWASGPKNGDALYVFARQAPVTGGGSLGKRG